MGTYTYNTTHKHAVASTSTGWSYQYDANGNMTRRDPSGSDYYDFVYDAENRIYQAKKNGSVIATFTYDGDGARVKAVQGSSTTVFVGSYYEKTGSTVTKYYMAGGQRVAMRKSGVVYWLVGDHLGSTSVVANQNATVHSRQLYKPWGESRYTYATLPTKRQYTGQYSYVADFGLYDYVARFYDPQLGRFSQADTVTPGGVQGLDRYAGMANNPLRYVDPTGHRPSCSDDAECLVEQEAFLLYRGSLDRQAALFGLSFSGNWTLKDKQAVINGAFSMGVAFSFNSSYSFTAFQNVFRSVNLEHVSYNCEEGCWGRAIDSHNIRFYGPSTDKLDQRLVVHEFGHVFNAIMANMQEEVSATPYDTLDITWINHPAFPRRGSERHGFAGPFPGWQQSTQNTVGEEFADMFIGWTYNHFARDEAGLARSIWMNQSDHMPYWISMAMGRH